MTHSLSESESNDAPIGQSDDVIRRARRRMRFWMIFGLLVTLLFGPYLYYRATSFQKRVRVFQLSNTNQVANTPVANASAADRNEGAGQLQSRPLKVMTWNIAHGRGVADSNWSESAEPKIERVMRIADFIRKQDVDIVVLNEVDFSATWSGGFDQAETIAVAAGYNWYARQTNLDFGFLVGRWKFGNVVLSRYPIENATAIDLPPCAEWEDWLVGRKRGLHCTVKIGDQSISVVGLHLEARGEPTRIHSAEFLNEWLQEIDVPVILAGDLNTTPSTAPNIKRKYSAAGYELVENSFDILAKYSGLQHVPDVVVDANQYTFPSTNPASAIDWFFFDETAFQPLNHRVLQTELSDHLPVLVDFRIEEEIK